MKIKLYLLSEDTSDGHNIGCYGSEDQRQKRMNELMREWTPSGSAEEIEKYRHNITHDPGEAWSLFTEQASRNDDYYGTDEQEIEVPGYDCPNCGRTYNLSHEWPDIPDIMLRIEPGEPVPAGECAHCGALVHNHAD